MHRVAIGVPGFNDPKYLRQCLESILATVPASVPVAYADDASVEDNVGAARTFEPRIHVIANERWHGSPYVRNQLTEWAFAMGPPIEFACLIDMDVTVQHGWLEALLECADACPWSGITTFTEASFEPMDRWRDPGCEYLRCEEVGFLCALCRLRALDEVRGHNGCRGMDERLRGCAHDSELCQRLNHDSGWRTYLVQQNLIKHKHGGHSIHNRVRGRFVQDAREESRGVWGHILGERDWLDTLPSSTPPPKEPPV